MECSAHPAAELFPLLHGSRLDELAADIKANGQREPVVLWKDEDGRDWLLDGRNRHAACAKLGIAPVTRRWEGENPWAYVWSLNGERRDIAEGQRAAIRLEIVEGEEKWKEKKARREATQSPGRPSKKIGGNVAPDKPRRPEPEREAAKSRGALAAEARVSPRTAQKALTVRKEAPALFQKVLKGEVQLNQAARQVSRQKAVDAIEAEPAPLPIGPFRVLVADPPWAYAKRKDDGTHRAALTYPDMTTDEICALPVGAMASDDSILWLWTTNAFMRDAFRVLDSWGFREKTILTWVKSKMGTGDWLRGKTEHCILAVRGRPTVVLTNQTTALEGAVREHSRKPDEFFALVEALCPGSKVEMFARKKREGWSAWGPEQEKF